VRSTYLQAHADLLLGIVTVRDDWPVTEIKNANHLTCIFKPQFKDEIAAWLKKNSK
jgi:hypothetical protein